MNNTQIHFGVAFDHCSDKSHCSNPFTISTIAFNCVSLRMSIECASCNNDIDAVNLDQTARSEMYNYTTKSILNLSFECLSDAC